jgi:hypothetical protein
VAASCKSPISRSLNEIRPMGNRSRLDWPEVHHARHPNAAAPFASPRASSVMDIVRGVIARVIAKFRACV